MSELSKRENQLDWACRILITLNVLIIVYGYFSFFNAQRQLMTPLIPKSTVYEILILSGNDFMNMSLISAGLFLTGIWCYTFKKKKIAIVFLSFVIILFLLMLFVF